MRPADKIGAANIGIEGADDRRGEGEAVGESGSGGRQESESRGSSGGDEGSGKGGGKGVEGV